MWKRTPVRQVKVPQLLSPPAPLGLLKQTTTCLAYSGNQVGVDQPRVQLASLIEQAEPWEGPMSPRVGVWDTVKVTVPRLPSGCGPVLPPPIPHCGMVSLHGLLLLCPQQGSSQQTTVQQTHWGVPQADDFIVVTTFWGGNYLP